MTTMKALLFERYRPPSILSIQQSPVPNLRTGEAPVELHASAISPSEVKNVADAFKASCRAFRDGLYRNGGGRRTLEGKEVWGSGAGFGIPVQSCGSRCGSGWP